MPRRGRRSGVRFIENDRDRSLTFFKRRAGLYKAAADLSTLTGARLAIVLESESGKFSSFGTPASGPVVDAFLSRNAQRGAYVDEEQKATITELQNELFQLEKDMVVEDKRKKEHNALVKELQESSRVGKFSYGKVEDLDVDEIREMYHELSHVHNEIQHFMPVVHHVEQHEVGGGLRDPSLLQPVWWRSLSSKMPPPRRLPRIPIHQSVQTMLPPHQFQPRSWASFTVPPQAEKRPTPREAIPYNYRIWGMDINSNNSNHFFQSPILSSPASYPSSPQIPQSNESSHPPSPSPQQFLLPLSVDGQLPFIAQTYSPIELSQNFASSGSSTPTDMMSQNFASSGFSTPTDMMSQNFASSGFSTPTDKLSQNFASSGSSTPTYKLSQNFASSGSSTPTDKLSQNFASSGYSTPTDKPYHASLGELNIDLGRNNENGGQIEGWIHELLSGSSSLGENSGAGGINFPWNYIMQEF